MKRSFKHYMRAGSLTAALVLFMAASASATDVSGDITSNRIWTTTESPYIVTGDVNVKSGATLTIEAGVTVEFSAGRSLNVLTGGGLVAVGTPETITFRASIETTGRGYWNRIYFESQTPQRTVFRYCTVKNSSGGLYLKSSPIQIYGCALMMNSNAVIVSSSDRASLESCVFSTNEVGVFFDAKSLSVAIKDCTLNRNSTGIYIRNFSSSEMTGNLITSNEVGILSVNSSVINMRGCDILYGKVGISTESGVTNVSYSNINSCETAGFYLTSTATINLDHNTMLKDYYAIYSPGSTLLTMDLGYNQILYCTEGIYTLWNVLTNLKMYNNLFDRSRIFIPHLGTFVSGSYVENNTIIGGGPGSGTGLFLRVRPCPSRFNTITGWGVGTATWYEGPGPRYNNFSGNVIGVSKGYPGWWDARWNYWGSSDGPGPIASGHGSGVTDLVVYEPWLTSPISYVSLESVASVKMFKDLSYTTQLAPSDSVGVLDRIFISVEASADPSPEAVNWTSVIVTSESDASGASFILTETASSSGVFNGEMRLDGTTTSSDNGLIKAAYGNKIRVRSTASPGVSASVSVGRLARWVRTNSPETVPPSTTLQLPAGSTLEIGAGVTVEVFIAGGLSVAGQLIASGEADSRITFNSIFSTPYPGSWNSVALSSGGRGFFKFCDFLNGTYGLNCQGASPVYVNNCRFISNSTAGFYASSSSVEVSENYFDHNGVGLSAGAGNSYLNVFGNIFYNNGTVGQQGGISCGNTAITIKGNTFDSNSPYGIFYNNTNSALIPTIAFNNFLDSASHGIYNNQPANPVSALHNWWGTSEGADLTDTRITPPALGGTTPGDNVSAYVYYEPFLAQGPAGFASPSAISSLGVRGGRGILERIFIKLEGTDGSSESVNWSTVKISSESYPAGIILDLVETGLDTGTYEGEARVVADPSSTSLGHISSEAGKYVNVVSLQDAGFSDIRQTLSVGTWEAADSPEILMGRIYTLPSGSTLLIAPSVTVEFDTGAGLSVLGTLYASGEPGGTITFTSRKDYPLPGDWQYMQFNGASSNASVLRNCDISYGGSGTSNYGNIWLYGSAPTIKGNVIRNSLSGGIYLTNSSYATIESNTFSMNSQYGIYCSSSRPHILSNTIASNGAVSGATFGGIYDVNDVAGALIQANIISSNEPNGIYYSSSSIKRTMIKGNTIEAGANSSVRYCIRCANKDPIVKFNNLIGYDSDDYGVNGLTSSIAIDASLNYWSNAKAGNYVISTPSVEGTLAYSPPSGISAVRSYKDKAFTALAAGGLGILDRVFISAEGTDSDPSNHNWVTVVVSNETTPASNILVDLVEKSPGLFNGEARIGSANDDWVDMVGSSVGNTIKASYGSTASSPLNVILIATWEAADNPERILNDSALTLPSGSILRVEPGARVEAGNAVTITISGSLEARGQKGSRILFTSANPNPSPGNWNYILFSSGKGLIAYSKISYALYGLNLLASSPLMAMVSSESNSLAGILLQTSSSPKVVDCDLANNPVGVRGYLAAYSGNPKINYNNLFSGGVSNESSTVTLEARYNWWNSPSGPNSTSKVFGKVNYTPYLTEVNVPGGPRATNSRPASWEALRDRDIPIRVNLFDPEDVNLSSVTVEMDGATYSWPSGLSYESSTNDLIFTHEAFAEGLHTFEVVGAMDIFDETLRAPLTTSFYIDLTSPEITVVTAVPYFAKAGNVLITVEASDVPSGIDYSVSPEVRLRYGGIYSPAVQASYSSGKWTGRLTILSTFENGPATVEVSGIEDMAGNICPLSLEAAQVFIDTVMPTVEVFSPTAGITLEGPSVYYITWETYDITPESGLTDEPISIYLVYGTLQPQTVLITSEVSNNSPYAWNVPPLTVDNSRIRVDAKDRAGNIGRGYSGIFSINTVNPYIVSTSPSNEEQSVPIYETIRIVFSKPMSRESVETAFTMNPYIGGTYEWTDGDSKTIYHPDANFNFNTTYEVTIDWGPSDKLGHSLLGVPYVFNFRTVHSESGKPTISRVKFDGRAYREGDIISSTPRVTAIILDSPEAESSGVSINDINVVLSSYTVHPDTYSPSGEMEVKFTSYPLGAGLYLVSIEAIDRAGNAAEPFTGKVRVIYGDVKVVGQPASYPTPFKPLSGERATIAYTLSTNADITIYMYDISSRVILTKKFISGANGGRAGYNSFDWDGKTEFGRVVGNGIYVYKIISAKKVLATGKLVVYD